MSNPIRFFNPTEAINPEIALVQGVGLGASGTFTGATSVTRTLNSVAVTASWLGLSSNQITLQPGTYFVEGSVPALAVNAHKGTLYSVTDSATAVQGTDEYAPAAAIIQTRSFVVGLVTLSSPKVFELRHRCSTTRSTDGLGDISNLGTQAVFAQIKITKIN